MFALYSERCLKPGQVLSKETCFFTLHLALFGALGYDSVWVWDRPRTGKAEALIGCYWASTYINNLQLYYSILLHLAQKPPCFKSMIVVWKLGSLHVPFLNHTSRLTFFLPDLELSRNKKKVHCYKKKLCISPLALEWAEKVRGKRYRGISRATI